MNQVFNLKRFLRLFFSHWTEYKKRYALFTLALAGIMLFGAICIIAVEPRHAFAEDMQYFMFHFVLFISGCIYAGTFLSNLNDKSKGITYILTPASTFEKLLLAFVFIVPIFLAVYILLFYIIDIPFVAISNSIRHQQYLQNNQFNYNGKFVSYRIISLLKPLVYAEYSYRNEEFKIFKNAFFGFFALQAFFLMGASYFKKFAFVKTILAGFLIMLFFSVFTILVFKNNNYNSEIFENYFSKKTIKDSYYYYGAGIFCFFKYGLTFIFYLITYFHIKEKEI